MKLNSKIVVGIATMNTRKKSLGRVVNCLQAQTLPPDEIYIYNNDENDFNATDNGKFYPLTFIKEDVYFFSMDDDIYYPPTYIQEMVKAIDTHNCIVTHHGRILDRKDVSYYGGHQAFGCLHLNEFEGVIDVAGTGVTAFHTSYFKPTNIFKSEYKRMSDLVFSLEAVKANREIRILKHKKGYFRDICDDEKNSCFTNSVNNQEQQIQLANSIIDNKTNKKVSIIVPYNKDRGYLQQALDSIKNQTYTNIEVIESFSENTVGYNLNRGIEKATGDYIKYLCDDDMLTPRSIELSVRGIKGYDFIHGNALTFYDNDFAGADVYHPRFTKPTMEQLLSSNVIHGGTLMYHKSVFERYGMFDESLTTGEEYDFNLMLFSKGARLNYVNGVLYKYRRHSEQKSLGNTSKEYQAERKIKINEIRNRYRSI